MDGEINDGLSPAGDAPPVEDRPERTSIARFLYNQNPFYLISCLLVIYGCQSLAVSGGSLFHKSLSMTGGIAAYTLLMALVCVAVVRLARVWEDARSIFLVVVISMAALTTGFDELCIGDQDLAMGFAGIASLVIVVVTESVLWLCRIRLRFWYRVALYSHFAVLIAFPLLLGRAVARRDDVMANWGSVWFSIAIALATLVLIPALRRGTESIRDNGTPWSWPLYPVSAFVVLLVLAGIRSHAIWMSFGFYGTAGKFEPFLLLPILAAVLVVIAETGLGLKRRDLQSMAFCATPLLLLCGVSRRGATWLPISHDVQNLFGSALTVALLSVLAIYLYLSIRGVRGAVYGVPATLVLMGWVAPLPRAEELSMLESWMFPAAASAVLLAMTLRLRNRDLLWASASLAASMTLVMIGNAWGQSQSGWLAAAALMTASMLVIGAVFRTGFAEVLRYAAAVAMTVGVLALTSRVVADPQGRWVAGAAALTVISLGYAFMVRRRGWIGVAALQSIFFFVTVGWNAHQTGQLTRVNWPIFSGLACLCIGGAITTGKTGAYRRISEGDGDAGDGAPKLRFFEPGL